MKLAKIIGFVANPSRHWNLVEINSMNDEACYDVEQGVAGPQPVYGTASNGVVVVSSQNPELGEMSVDLERWKRIDKIFHAVVQSEPSARAEFLTKECAGDDSLRKELERLIECHEQESNLFDRPPSDLAAALLAREGAYPSTISHYRILRKIGRGGMGEVYLAEDTRLNRKVALKLLPLIFTENKNRILRFEREARAVSALNHPYILTIHDIGHTDSSSFIATEYIDGESLRQRMRVSKVPLGELLTIVIQVAEALDAAHQSGIIHRDIKPENIMLRKDGYVKVLDFGLAKLTEPTAGASNLETHTQTQIGVVIGTVRYMSPEQARGLVIDARSDIFSLGVVLYELISGRNPFEGGTSSDVIAAILEKNPPALRNFGEFPEDLQWIVTKALAKDREDRYQAVKELLTDLKRIRKRLEIKEELKRSDDIVQPTPGTFAEAAIVPTSAWTRRRAGFTVILVATAILLSYYFISRPEVPSSSTARHAITQGARPSIAVIGFKNLSSNPKDAWLSVAIAEMLTTELAQAEKLRAIPGETIHRVKEELALPDVQTFEQNTLDRLGKNLAADYVLLGSYMASGNRIRLDLRLQDTRSGETKASFSEDGSLHELFELVSRTGSHLCKNLDIDARSKRLDVASFSSNPEAIRLYAEGLSKLRLFNYAGAKDDLEKAVEMEPKFTMARSALSLAWTKIGYLKKAKEEAQKAMDLSSNLSREEQLLIQARYHQAAEEYEKASEMYQTLFRLFPDNIEYGLLQAETNLSISKAQEAIKVIETIRSIPSSQKDDPRIDLMEAKALNSLGDYKAMLPKLNDAVRKAESLGARRLLTKAYYQLSSAFYALGEKEKSREAEEKADKLYDATGDQDIAADKMMWKARILIEEGKRKEGEQYLNESLRIYETMGNRFRVAGVYFQIAGNAEDAKSANQAYFLALKKAEEVEHKHFMATILNNWAYRNVEDGNIQEAQKHYEQSLEIFRKMGQSEYAAGLMVNLGSVCWSQGKLKMTEQYYRESMDLLQALGHKPQMANSMLILAALYIDNGRLKEATEFTEQGLSVVQETGEKSEIARVFALRALILINQGKLMEAKKSWEEAKKIDKTAYFVKEASLDLLYAEGKLEEAAAEYERARKNAKGNETLESLEIRNAKLKRDTNPAESRRLALAIPNQKIWYVNNKASISAIIAQTYLNEGKVAEAEKAMTKIDSIENQLREFFADRIEVELVRARILSAKGDHKKAKVLLNALLSETKNAGYVPLQYEVLLTLGEIEMKSGERETGITRMQGLKNEAFRNGYILVSQKASDLVEKLL